MINFAGVRWLSVDDLEQIISVEEGAWEPDLRASKETILQRFEENPEGFIGYFESEQEGSEILRAFIYFRRIKEYSHITTWKQASQEPLDPNGKVAYIVNVSAYPKKQGHGRRLLINAHRLLEEIGIEHVVLGSRDTTEKFYEKCGYITYQRYANWWPEDKESAGKGILMKHEIKKVYK